MKRNGMTKLKRLAALTLSAVMAVTTLPATICAAGETAIGDVTKAQLDELVKGIAKYVHQTVSEPMVGSIGGEWAVMGLARSGYDVPNEWYEIYYTNLEEYTKDYEGVLHKKKYTDYSRVTVALSAIGGDPKDVAGYDLLKPLGDFDKTIWQGINGPIWALIALDSIDYDVPVNEEAAVQATRDKYLAEILRRQLNDGGFSLTGGKTEETKSEAADPDITGMALQALAKYQDRPEVKAAIDKALTCLSEMQSDDGGFSTYGTANVESCAQAIVALNELGISLNDSRFVKNGKTLLDDLMSYRTAGGGFLHIKNAGVNQMATEQGFYALVSIQRAMEGKNSLYRMSDAVVRIAFKNSEAERPTANIFPDVKNHKNQAAIEAMGSRNIISGRKNGNFDPDATMTRAEFAAIVVNVLDLELKITDKFTDVPANKWYAGYVGTANIHGIVNGTSATTFKPDGTITKQEAAAMVVNAAKLAGLDTAMTAEEAQTVLSKFADCGDSAGWAKPFLGYCYEQGILDLSDSALEPRALVKRCEIAEMLYRMMGKAELL